MESQYVLTIDGTEVTQDDLNLLGREAALADDHVLAEFVRMAPFLFGRATKGIWPSGWQGPLLSSDTAPLVAPVAAAGSVTVRPFRAFVGATSTITGNAKANLRDTRSVMFVAAATDDGIATVTFGANSSGNARWDLVYAQVTIDQNDPSVTRYVKNPTLGTEGPTSMSVTKSTAVNVLVLPGTPSPSPTWPAVPTDAAGSYYIALAYVRIPNGFTATSDVNPVDIADVVYVPTIANQTGAATVTPVGPLRQLTTATQQTNWGNHTPGRPSVWMPGSMSGAHSLLIAFDFTDASPANWSHADGSLVDVGRDWRNRITQFMATGVTGAKFLWNNPGTLDAIVPDGGSTSGANSTTATSAFGFGGTFTAGVGGRQAQACLLNHSNLGGALPSGAIVGLRCDTNGNLIVGVTGTPGCAIFIWLTLSAPYGNSF